MIKEKKILESILENKIEKIIIMNSKLYNNRIKSNFLDLIVKVDDKYINIEINTAWNDDIKEI